MNRFFLALSGILFSTLLGVLFTGSSVSAATVYDEYFTVADELKIAPYGEDVTETELCDFSNSYAGIFLHDDLHQNMKGLWDQRTGWSVSRLEGTTTTQLNGERYFGWIEISFYIDSIQATPGAYWDDAGTHVAATWANAYSVRFRTNSDCSEMILQSDHENPAPGNPTLWMRNKVLGRYWAEPFLTYNMDVNYPAGYEGEIIPETHILPLNNSPKMSVVSVVDWKITLQDENFITLGEWPFTCDKGLPPIIQYDLYNNDTDPITLIDTGTDIPALPYTFQAEDYGVETEFRFIAIYYCGTGNEEPTFSKQTNFTFTVNSEGIYFLPTDSCFTETFPYIDLNGCMGVMSGLLNNLSFGTINLPDWSIENNNCHTLSTMGDWLNVPSTSRTICPKFSEEVRSIVTPFLTFVLGITILGALITKSKDDTH